MLVLSPHCPMRWTNAGYLVTHSFEEPLFCQARLLFGPVGDGPLIPQISFRIAHFSTLQSEECVAYLVPHMDLRHPLVGHTLLHHVGRHFDDLLIAHLEPELCTLPALDSLLEKTRVD